MKKTVCSRVIRCLAVPAVFLVAGCDFSSNITIRNQLAQTLVPYPVRETPPPPHREADPANSLELFDTAPIDPSGFNPVYYASGIENQSSANGLFIGLDSLDADPFHIQFKVFHYKVPPGEAGSDPDLQPILLHQGIVEVEDVNQLIRVRTVITSPPPGGWQIDIGPA